MLTVYFDDPQVAAAVAAVKLLMEHDDTPLAIIGESHRLHPQAAATDLLRRHIDGLIGA